MIKLKEFFYDLDEDSDAAKQAKQHGLVSGGWGWWKNAQGKTVAKTVNGKLVFTSGANQPAQASTTTTTEPKYYTYTAPNRSKQSKVSNRHRSRQLTNPQSQEDYWRNERPERPLRNKAYFNYLTPEKFNEYFRDDNFYLWEPENGHHYFKAAVHRMRENFQKFKDDDYVIEESKAVVVVHAFVKDMFEILNVPPNYQIHTFDPGCEKIHSLTGTRALGIHYSSLSTIGLSEDTCISLYHFAQTTDADWHAFRNKLNTKRGYESTDEYNEYKRMYDAVSTVIHESIHAKDKFVNQQKYDKYSAYIVEGLTERKARIMMYDLFHKENPSLGTKLFSMGGRSYENEVNNLQILDHMRTGILDELWKEQDPRQREALITKTLTDYMRGFLTRYSPLYSMEMHNKMDGQTRALANSVMDRFSNIMFKNNLYEIWQQGIFNQYRYGVLFGTDNAFDMIELERGNFWGFWKRRLDTIEKMEKDFLKNPIENEN